MKKQLKSILLLSLVVLLSSFSSSDKTKETESTTISAPTEQLKAAFTAPNRKIYFFTNDSYYRYNSTSHKTDNTDLISKSWKGVPNNPDAVLLHTNGKGYFFKGGSYYRYNFGTKKVEQTGVIGVSGWKGVPKNVDAVIHAKGKTYFFKGNTYYRYNSTTKKVDKSDLISKSWKGVPNNVDAAFQHINGKYYFFKGNSYYRYNSTSRKVDKEGTVGVDGWKGLSFAKELKKPVASSKNNIRLKVTLTRIKSIQARDSDDIADFLIIQKVGYNADGNQKLASKKKITLGLNTINIEDESSTIIQTANYGYTTATGGIELSQLKGFHVKEGDENHFINNSLVYEITPQEIKDQRADFNFNTTLGELDGDHWINKNITILFEENDIKKIAKNHFIDVNIHEVLDYLQNPKAAKYGKSYFKGGRGGDMHEYGSFGDVMWFKKGSNNSLIGHLEFGANNKETYVRLYYRFELMP